MAAQTTRYTHVLAAVEIHESGQAVMARARDLARVFDARLSILHVVEYLPVDPAGDALLTAPIDLSRERAQQAEGRLHEWCHALGIPTERAQVAIGSVTTEILRVAREGGVDLIVVGHHPRRGLSALFSHTEEGVVQRAGCDVLALYLK
ncbi:MAG: universal stress protein [Gammaproteobacteria bacterium]|nr:universal stress protein [Gammaproteobacteria bacterium]